MNPKDLLFKPLADNTEQVLFKSQKEIVDLISLEESAGNESKTGRKNSLKVFLSNCINGKKKLSKELKDNLSKVLDKRLVNFDQKDSIKNKIFNAFDIVHRSYKASERNDNDIFELKSTLRKSNVSLIRKSRSDKRIHQTIFEEFLKRTDNAKKIVSTSGTPCEITDSKTSYKMIEFISNSIGLFGKDSAIKEFVYYFPKKNKDEIAIEFWKKVYFYNEMIGVPFLEDSLIEANENNLKIYSVDAEIVNFPVTCLNYDDYYKEYAYNTNLVDDLLVVMPLNSENLKYWKNNLESISDDKIEEITFEKAKKVFSNKFAY